MDKTILELRKVNRKSKEDLLKYLFNLEKQEMLNNQVPVFAFPQKRRLKTSIIFGQVHHQNMKRFYLPIP